MFFFKQIPVFYGQMAYLRITKSARNKLLNFNGFSARDINKKTFLCTLCQALLQIRLNN